MSTDSDKAKNTKNIWKKNGFSWDQKGELTIFKINFPQKTLIYCNQGSISTVKAEIAIYLIKVVLGQVIPMRNCPPDIDSYFCKSNEVKILVHMYNTETGDRNWWI